MPLEIEAFKKTYAQQWTKFELTDDNDDDSITAKKLRPALIENGVNKILVKTVKAPDITIKSRVKIVNRL